jgi:small subunit ribosomal protein S17
VGSADLPSTEERPMSKLKTWKVIERVQAGKTAAVEADV